MTEKQIRNEIRRLRKTINERVRDGGVSTETISTASGGSRSVSYEPLANLRAELSQLEKDLAACRASARHCKAVYPWG